VEAVGEVEGERDSHHEPESGGLHVVWFRRA
jgi:hypothetical protein